MQGTGLKAIEGPNIASFSPLAAATHVVDYANAMQGDNNEH